MLYPFVDGIAEKHRRTTRKTNLLERLFAEERRRTKVIPHAFGERAVLKLMYAALIRASKSWKRVAISEFELPQLEQLREHLNRLHAARVRPSRRGRPAHEFPSSLKRFFFTSAPPFRWRTLPQTRTISGEHVSRTTIITDHTAHSVTPNEFAMQGQETALETAKLWIKSVRQPDQPRIAEMIKKTLINIMVSVISLTATWGALEICARIYKNEYRFYNFWAETRDLLRSAYPAEFDKQLGWIPRQGSAGIENVWGTQVTILLDGIRANGKRQSSPLSKEGDLILAIGDSFTFGDQVSDHQTWPAFLEELTGIRTLNGGVFGYGLDQSYLRMKSLAKKYQPTHIVLSFIPNDISRCELSERTSVAKPYFEQIGNDLLLRNDHIIETSNDDGYLRPTLGYSFLIHKLMSRTFPEYWFQGSWHSNKVHSDGEAIACALFREIEVFLEETPRSPKFYLLIQYGQHESPESLEMIDRVLSCIHGDKIHVVDLRYIFSELQLNDNKKYERMFQGGHMTAEGNYFVAQILAKRTSK